MVSIHLNNSLVPSNHRIDPRYEEEVSGCTASVGIITNEKIYVVRFPLDIYLDTSDMTRRMLVIQGRFWASREERNLCRLTTSPKMKVWRMSKALGNTVLT